MPDQPEQQTAAEPQVDAGGSVLSFHVGDTRQVGAVAAPLTLRTPKARPAFGVDDEGNPRPDPTLAAPEPAPEPEPRRSVRESSAPEKPAEKPPTR